MKRTEYIIGNAVVSVHRPELSEAERAMWESSLLIALEKFGKAMTEAERVTA